MSQSYIIDSSNSVCSDCNNTAPQWMSINRGVLICDDCCVVHRSLGSHVSNVRSITDQVWSPSLAKMCNLLLERNANTVWEHELCQKNTNIGKHHSTTTQNKPRKPNPNDPINPVKENFIKAKYINLSYISKPQERKLVQNIDQLTVQDLSEQLHASARTDNIKTCLRLLALGANPSYMHPHRGSYPLHIAAQAGQLAQVELLCVYGANPCSLDKLGHTPEECARIAGHHELADRLIELQYECADRLSFFLTKRFPNHKENEHFLVNDNKNDVEDADIGAFEKLFQLSNHSFEHLSQDMHDEVNRRETEKAWKLTMKAGGLPFLPNNSSLTTLRNQARQKLALLNDIEISRLVKDILLEIQRRQDLSVSGEINGDEYRGTLVALSDSYNPIAVISKTEPDYDIVPDEIIIKYNNTKSKGISLDKLKGTHHSLRSDKKFKVPVEKFATKSDIRHLEERIETISGECEDIKCENQIILQNFQGMKIKLESILKTLNSLSHETKSTSNLSNPPNDLNDSHFLQNTSASLFNAENENFAHRQYLSDSVHIKDTKDNDIEANIHNIPTYENLLLPVNLLIKAIQNLRDCITGSKIEDLPVKIRDILLQIKTICDLYSNTNFPDISIHISTLKNAKSSLILLNNSDITSDTQQSLTNLLIGIALSAKKLLSISQENETGVFSI